MDSLRAGLQVAFEVVDVAGNTALDNPDEFLEPFYYRILTASQQIKYLGVTKTEPNDLDIRGDELSFNTVPDSNWPIGTLTLDPTARKLIPASTTKMQLLQIEATWHPNKIDLVDVGDPLSSDQELLCHSKTHSTIHRGHFGATRTMVHLEWNPNRLDIVDIITNIYSRIEGYDIGPRFLAHVTDNHSRVIGYMVEGLSGRHAILDDREACPSSMGSGLYMDNRVFLHEFSNSYVTEDPEELGMEMAGLEEALKGNSERPKYLINDLSHKLLAVLESDGRLHPLLVLYAQKEGRMMEVTKEEYKQMSETLWVDNDRFMTPPEWR